MVNRMSSIKSPYYNPNYSTFHVPSYEILFNNQKNFDYCLVIPVINEGNRIINLLEKIKNLNISNTMLDVIIIDGGSTDNSLEHSRLKELNVNTLLLKTGQGKLSSQLRCAYDYALNEGYKGILTIDGNNKDDPSPIPLFIEKLKSGYDFVQASRFISGGTAVNTPKSRDFAIRFIHAPVLSCSSGFHWTDTTQGFRAYSDKLLSDNNVAIFRDIFQKYELLAYLSHIAPKLGFKCIEVASTRIYPKGEIPTKISSFKGNLEVLKVLFKAAFGIYNRK